MQVTGHGTADAYYDRNRSFSTDTRPANVRPPRSNPPLRYGYHDTGRPREPHVSRPPVPYVPRPHMADAQLPLPDKPVEPSNPFDHSIKPGLIGTLKGLRGMIIKDPELIGDTPERYELLRRTERFLNSKLVRYFGVLWGKEVAAVRREMEEVAQFLLNSAAKREDRGIVDGGAKIGAAEAGGAEAGTLVHTGGRDCPCLHVPRNCTRSRHPNHSDRPHICRRKRCRSSRGSG